MSAGGVDGAALPLVSANQQKSCRRNLKISKISANDKPAFMAAIISHFVGEAGAR